MILRNVVAEVVVCGTDNIDERSGDNINVNIVCHQGLVEILQFIREGNSGDEACGDYATLAFQFNRRGPDFLAVASVVGPVSMGSKRQIIYFVRSHAGKEVGNPRIRNGCIKGIAYCAIHVAKLGCKVLILIGRMDIGKVVGSACTEALVIIIQPLIVGSEIGDQICHGHIAVCEILSDRFV